MAMTTKKSRPFQVGHIVRDFSTGVIARVVAVFSEDIGGATEHFYTLDDSVPLLPDAGYENRSRHTGEVVDAFAEHVKRRAILTPDRRPILTPLDRELVSH